MTPSDRFRGIWRNNDRKAIISVHRGLWGPAPENSLSAIKAAAALGIVEIDIQLAADGVPVVIHDDTLDRMTGLSASVSEMASADITRQKLREGEGGPTGALTGECVPLFSDVLATAPEDAFFDFDVKHPGEVEAVAAFLADHGAQHRGSLKIDTTTDAEIEYLRDLEDRFGLMVMAKVILPEAGLDHIEALAAAGVAAAEVWFGSTGELTEACRIAGDRLAISTYTLDPVHCCGLSDSVALTDPDAVWGTLIDAGVPIIMTDRPRQLSDYLAAL